MPERVAAAGQLVGQLTVALVVGRARVPGDAVAGRSSRRTARRRPSSAARSMSPVLSGVPRTLARSQPSPRCCAAHAAASASKPPAARTTDSARSSPACAVRVGVRARRRPGRPRSAGPVAPHAVADLDAGRPRPPARAARPGPCRRRCCRPRARPRTRGRRRRLGRPAARTSAGTAARAPCSQRSVVLALGDQGRGERVVVAAVGDALHVGMYVGRGVRRQQVAREPLVVVERGRARRPRRRARPASRRPCSSCCRRARPRGPFSSSSTRRPRSAAASAALCPALPPPTTTTSYALPRRITPSSHPRARVLVPHEDTYVYRGIQNAVPRSRAAHLGPSDMSDPPRTRNTHERRTRRWRAWAPYVVAGALAIVLVTVTATRADEPSAAEDVLGDQQLKIMAPGRPRRRLGPDLAGDAGRAARTWSGARRSTTSAAPAARSGSASSPSSRASRTS